MEHINKLKACTKLHEMFRLALDDFKQFEQSPNCCPAMSVYFDYSTTENVCYACVAGSIFYADVGLTGIAAHLDKSECGVFHRLDVWTQMMIINDLRQGNVQEALSRQFRGEASFDMKHKAHLLSRHIPPYFNPLNKLSNRVWWEAVENLYVDLKEANL